MTPVVLATQRKDGMSERCGACQGTAGLSTLSTRRGVLGGWAEMPGLEERIAFNSRRDRAMPGLWLSALRPAPGVPSEVKK